MVYGFFSGKLPMILYLFLLTTSNGTAIGGDEIDLNKQTCDYEFVEKGLLHFENGETSKNIMIKTNPSADVSEIFFIIWFKMPHNYIHLTVITSIQR